MGVVRRVFSFSPRVFQVLALDIGIDILLAPALGKEAPLRLRMLTIPKSFRRNALWKPEHPLSSPHRSIGMLGWRINGEQLERLATRVLNVVPRARWDDDCYITLDFRSRAVNSDPSPFSTRENWSTSL